MKYLIVGAGFSGAVIAEQLSRKADNRILVIEERNHLAGNCHTERDSHTGVMLHRYGPHIFHTSDEHVWEYIQRFGEIMPFVNRVKTVYQRKVYTLPINLHTINQFFGKAMNPAEAQAFIRSLGDHSIQTPANFEQQALKFIGKELYEAFFDGYTRKQWGCPPAQLPASILQRLPVRFSYNDNYYNDRYQGIPKAGYTALIEKMMEAPNIELQLGTKYNQLRDLSDFDHIFYSGAIDEYFDYQFGRLSYRTVFFEKNTAEGDFQGNAVINYADQEIPYTRIHEHKHFAPWEHHEQTVYFKEYSKETEPADTPYYPKRAPADLEKLKHYQQAANRLKNVTFVGRLGTYRYMDMDKVIGEALETVKKIITDLQKY